MSQSISESPSSTEPTPSDAPLRKGTGGRKPHPSRVFGEQFVETLELQKALLENDINKAELAKCPSAKVFESFCDDVMGPLKYAFKTQTTRLHTRFMVKFRVTPAHEVTLKGYAQMLQKISDELSTADSESPAIPLLTTMANNAESVEKSAKVLASAQGWMR